MRAVVLLGLIGACTDAEPRVEHYDTGEACVLPDVDAGQRPLVVRVTGFTCSTCDRAQQASCRISRAGNTLRVTSEASWITYDGPCTREACQLQATCEIGSLAPATYTLKLGSASTTFVPAEAVDFSHAPCVRSYD